MLSNLTLAIGVKADESCPALPNGLVLNKYYLEGCGPCKRLAPIYEDIKSQLERNSVDVKFRELECKTCDCKGVTSFPTLEITKDGNSISKKVGFAEIDQIKQWLSDELKITIDLEEPSSKVKKLTNKDFSKGFDGQNLILFYDRKSEPLRKTFAKLSEEFEFKVKFSEVYAPDVRSIASRFNIESYPHIIAVNHGTTVPYFGSTEYSDLYKLTETLYTPAFENITYEQLKGMNLENGEPVYIVLYKNFELASQHFNDLAQQFKFKAKIFRSNDPAMFDMSGRVPEEKGSDDDQVHLMVFKNSTFFTCPFKVTKRDEIIQWIFHTHFPYVTNLNNLNFYTVFHGIKPVFLLLTEGEHLVDRFNKISADKHLGFPFADMIFATLDANEYPDFTKNVLGKVKNPSLLFYNPLVAKWYYKKVDLTEKNFETVAHDTIDLYFTSKLPDYPPKESFGTRYLLYTVFVGITALIAKSIYQRKNKEY